MRPAALRLGDQHRLLVTTRFRASRTTLSKRPRQRPWTTLCQPQSESSLQHPCNDGLHRSYWPHLTRPQSRQAIVGGLSFEDVVAGRLPWLHTETLLATSLPQAELRNAHEPSYQTARTIPTTEIANLSDGCLFGLTIAGCPAAKLEADPTPDLQI